MSFWTAFPVRWVFVRLRRFLVMMLFMLLVAAVTYAVFVFLNEGGAREVAR